LIAATKKVVLIERNYNYSYFFAMETVKVEILISPPLGGNVIYPYAAERESAPIILTTPCPININYMIGLPL